MFVPLDPDLAKAMLDRKPKSLRAEFKEYMFSYKFKLALTNHLREMVKNEREQKALRKEFVQLASAEKLGF